MLVALRTRAATPDDYVTWARLFTQLAPENPVPDALAWQSRLMPHTVMFELGDRVVAYGRYEVLAGAAHVRQLVVDHAMRGQGIGAAALALLGARFRAEGCDTWHVNVEASNEPAQRLYRAAGMRLDYEAVALEVAWDAVDALAPTAPPREAREVTAHECDAIERAHSLRQGRLAQSLGRPDCAVLRVCDPARPDDLALGVARFDLAYAGALPFRARDVGSAKTLLQAMRTRRQPRHAGVTVVVEGDAQLTNALIPAGAREGTRMLHLRGALP